MMRQFSLLAVTFLLLCSWCQARVSITEGATFNLANPFSDRSSAGSARQMSWATEDVLIATAANRMIQAFDTTSGDELWRREFASSVAAIAAYDRHVFVALENSGSNWERAQSVRRLDLATGADSTPAGIPQPFLPHTLIWVDELDALSLLHHGELWIYSEDLLSVQTRIPYTGWLRFVSHSGSQVLLVEGADTCTLIDLKAASATHIHGPSNEGRNHTIAIDAPFLSNAFAHADGRLIRVVDNSWATGRIYFHSDPEAEPRAIDSENGHAVAAVHWETQRLAISGTGEDLVLFSTSGDRLVEVKQVAEERVFGLEFSPSGERLAAFSGEGVVGIFTIR